MPNIKTYDTPALDIRPSETGVEAIAGAARRAGAFYNQAGGAYSDLGQRAGAAVRDAGEVAVKSIEHGEISKGAATFAQMQDDLTKQWNETAKTADPNDPSVAAKFREEVVAPTLDQYSSGFLTEGGQKFAEHHVEALRNHLFEKTAADMSTLAGEAVRRNVAQTANSLASAVRLDPSSLDFSLKTAESSIGAVVDSSPTMSATDAGRVKSEVLQKTQEAIVKSAVMGMIEKNPNIDLDKIEAKYGKYITGPEIQMFGKAAKTQARADILINKQIDAYQRQQNTEAAHTAANKSMSENVSIDPVTNRPIVKPQFFKDALEIAKMPNAPDGLARTLLDWGEHQQNLKDTVVRDDPTKSQELYTGLFNNDKPTTEVDILRAEIEKKISPQTGTMMRALSKELEERPLKGPLWTNTMSAVKGTLGTDPQGDEKFGNFVQAFIPEYLRQSRAGTLPPNALDTRDPKSLISQAMAPYKRTAQQMLFDRISHGLVNTDAADIAGRLPTAGTPAPPITLPPATERKVGETYPTARGKMKWTGTGWVAP